MEELKKTKKDKEEIEELKKHLNELIEKDWAKKEIKRAKEQHDYYYLRGIIFSYCAGLLYQSKLAYAYVYETVTEFVKFLEKNNI